MTSDPCCPPESIGPVPLSKKVTKGQVIQLEPKSTNRNAMPAYVVGKTDGGASRAVVVFSDVFGVDTGNHKVVCDALAEKLGKDTLVIMPDLFRGVAILGGWGLPKSIAKALVLPSILFNIRTRISRKNINSDLESLVFPYLQEKISKNATIASVGFCFGGWVTGLALALESFNCQVGVAVHPSWKVETAAGGDLGALGKSLGTKPILFLPSKTDLDTKPDSLLIQELAEQRGVQPSDISVEFPNQIHGWITRGDDSDVGFKQDFDKALELTVKFIKDSKV